MLFRNIFKSKGFIALLLCPIFLTNTALSQSNSKDAAYSPTSAYADYLTTEQLSKTQENPAQMSQAFNETEYLRGHNNTQYIDKAVTYNPEQDFVYNPENDIKPQFNSTNNHEKVLVPLKTNNNNFKSTNYNNRVNDKINIQNISDRVIVPLKKSTINKKSVLKLISKSKFLSNILIYDNPTVPSPTPVMVRRKQNNYMMPADNYASQTSNNFNANQNLKNNSFSNNNFRQTNNVQRRSNNQSTFDGAYNEQSEYVNIQEKSSRPASDGAYNDLNRTSDMQINQSNQPIFNGAYNETRGTISPQKINNAARSYDEAFTGPRSMESKSKNVKSRPASDDAYVEPRRVLRTEGSQDLSAYDGAFLEQKNQTSLSNEVKKKTTLTEPNKETIASTDDGRTNLVEISKDEKNQVADLASTEKLYQTDQDLLNSVNKSLKQGNNKKAEETLDLINPDSDNIELVKEVTFLRGMAAQQQDKFAEAETHFRKLLNKDPSITRVRLELARSLFHQKKTIASTRHFKQALADDIPLVAKQKIQKYLSEIEKQRWWNFSARASIRPDTNINNGTSDSTVDIWGIPFLLDDSAQKNSGIGIAGNTSLFFAPKLTENTKWKTSFNTSFINYKESKYSSSTLSAETGPVFYFDKSSVGLSLHTSKMSLGNVEYAEYTGSSLLYSGHFKGKYSGGGSLFYSKSTYNQYPTKDGHSAGLNLFLGLPLSSRSYLNTGFTLSNEKTTLASLDNTTMRFNTSISSELPYGVNAMLKPQIFNRIYDGADEVFNTVREDNSYGFDVALVKRDWIFRGFVPEFRYSYLQNHSNISLYEFDRHRANIGITRDF